MKITDIRTQVSTNYGDWIEKFGELWKTQAEQIKKEFSSGIEEIYFPIEEPTDMATVCVSVKQIIPLLQFLKTDPGMSYNFLSDITAVDHFEKEGGLPKDWKHPRFEVVYHLFSHRTKARIRVKVRLNEGESVPTSEGVWKAANWCEREVWDMFGIEFSGHSDLRRILMDERWEGHPLRKDYQLKGYQIFTTPEPINEELLKDD